MEKTTNTNMVKILTSASILLLFYLFSFIFSLPASAVSQGLSVSPIIINVPLSPGKIYKHDITVQNLTDAPLPLKAELNDFQTTGEEGGYIFENTKSNPLLSWITLSDTDLILNPKEKKTIELTITTPKSIPLGGYYGILFFEPVNTLNINTSTRVSSKIGILLLANIGVLDPNAKNAKIETYTTGLFHENSQIPLLLRVKNISLHFFTAKPILTISPLFNPFNTRGKPIYLEEKIIFQGKVRRWEQLIDLNNLKPNIYKARLVLSTGNGQFVNQDQYFIIFPFSSSLSIAGILLVGIFIIIKRKRLKNVLKALFSKNG